MECNTSHLWMMAVAIICASVVVRDSYGRTREGQATLLTEFGRTARVNGAAGRDHWPFTNSIGFSGAGVRMGSVVGKTDSKCERVVGREHTTLDYAATIFHLMGIDDTQEYRTNDGRPVLINGGGRALDEVLA